MPTVAVPVIGPERRHGFRAGRITLGSSRGVLREQEQRPENGKRGKEVVGHVLGRFSFHRMKKKMAE